MTRAYWIMGRTNEAITIARSAIERISDILYGHAQLPIILADTGRDAEARLTVAEVLRINPKFSVEAWSEGRGQGSEVAAREVDALRKAGLPE